MEMENRPNPDELLRLNFPEEKGEKRGKLKIFFGYAAGVGKTYGMLEAAREEKAAGKDVVAGYVEPHNRPDTMALLDGLEQIKPQTIQYKGIELKEFDLDAAIRRCPELILVDELAHTNAEGCRHRKRYQDVTELLDAGIDVFTTVNVQHLESLHDIVASITRVRVSERVPDRMFDQADQVELVDIEPKELRRRLEEGKIYCRERAGRAALNFFSVANLTALREIALRRTADRVNREVVKKRMETGGGYYTGEHVLVCLSPSPTNAKVIRTAARMASAFHGEFTAVLVETMQIKRDRGKLSKSLEENIGLAKQFGANVITLYGEDVVEQIAGYAERNGVSKIVIGRTVQRARLLYVKPTLIDRLIKQVPNLDVYVIPDIRASHQPAKKHIETVYGARRWADGLKTAGILCACTALSFETDRLGMGSTNVVMIYIMGVMLVSYLAKNRIYGAAASLAAVLLYNYFFTDPRYTLRAHASVYPFTFLAMLVCALLTSTLASRLKKQAVISRTESGYMQILLNISRNLRKGNQCGEVLMICGRQIVKLLGKNVVIYNTLDKSLGQRTVYRAKGAECADCAELEGKDEEAVASWVYKNRRKAGRSTDTLPGANARYMPVYKDDRVYAVIGIQLEKGESIAPNDKNVLNIIVEETASRLKDVLERQGGKRQP